MPNVYLLDITASNRKTVMDLVSKQPGVDGEPEILGAVSATIQSIDGVPVIRERLEGMARRYARTVSVSTAVEKPPFTQVLAGQWWPAGRQPSLPELSVAEPVAKLLKINVGSRINWVTPQRSFSSIVVAIHKSESVRLTARVEFYFTAGALDGLPAIYYGGVRAKPPSVPAIQKVLYDKFPTVTVVNMADVLDTIQGIVDQISLVVRFISFFSILAGIVILASGVAGTRFRRIREVVILKTLGATRQRIARIFSVEFFVIGAVAGLMGGLLAGGFAWLVLNRLLRANAAPDLMPMLVAIAATALLAVATGWAASFRTLGQKPLEILRDE
jgi:putative ABC transport system permease protein